MRIDRDDIERLYVEYTNTIDDGDLGHWPDLFTAECSYRIVSRENVRRKLPLAAMRCDSREMLHDRVVAIESSAFYVSRTVRHLVGPLDIAGIGLMVRASGSGIAPRGLYTVTMACPFACGLSAPGWERWRFVSFRRPG